MPALYHSFRKYFHHSRGKTASTLLFLKFVHGSDTMRKRYGANYVLQDYLCILGEEAIVMVKLMKKRNMMG
jgi:hypothetical protein